MFSFQLISQYPVCLKTSVTYLLYVCCLLIAICCFLSSKAILSFDCGLYDNCYVDTNLIAKLEDLRMSIPPVVRRI